MSASGTVWLLLCGLAAVVLAGCAARDHSPVFQQYGAPSVEQVCTIAVLPFINETNYPQGDLLLQRIFAAELIESGHFRVSQEGDVRNIYRQMRIYPGQAPDYEKIKVVANRLGVQMVVIGKITAMEEKSARSVTNPILSVVIDCYDANTGKLLWSTYHRREGSQYRTIMHFGLVTTLPALARRLSREIIETWYSQGLQPCNE